MRNYQLTNNYFSYPTNTNTDAERDHLRLIKVVARRCQAYAGLSSPAGGTYTCTGMPSTSCDAFGSFETDGDPSTLTNDFVARANELDSCQRCGNIILPLITVVVMFIFMIILILLYIRLISVAREALDRHIASAMILWCKCRRFRPRDPLIAMVP